MMKKNKEGISMIIVLWIIAILTVLTATTALVTTSDVSSTLNLIRNKKSAQLAETGSEYMLSFIPNSKIIRDSINYTDSVTIGGTKRPVYRKYTESDSTESYVIFPIPMIDNTPPGVNPYTISIGGQGSYLVYDFNTAGIVGEDDVNPQKVLDISAGWLDPSGKIDHPPVYP